MSSNEWPDLTAEQIAALSGLSEAEIEARLTRQCVDREPDR